MRRRNAAAVTFLLCSGAQGFTGNELLAYCDAESLVKQTYCMGFIRGVVDGFRDGYGDGYFMGGLRLSDDPKGFAVNYEAAIAKRENNPYCVPDGATNNQLLDMLRRFLDENPHRRHEEALRFVVSAVSIPFICPD